MSASEKFVEAQKAFAAINARIDGYATAYGTVAEGLRTQRGKFAFSNTSGGLPMDVILGKHVSVNADEVATPAKIQAALAEWHNARDALRNAWNALPPEMSQLMQKPAGL